MTIAMESSQHGGNQLRRVAFELVAGVDVDVRKRSAADSLDNGGGRLRRELNGSVIGTKRLTIQVQAGAGTAWSG